MMTVLRSLAFHIGFFALTALLAIAALPVLLGPPAWSRRLGSIWSGAVLWLARNAAGLDYRIEGRLPDGPAIIAAKHQSAFDTYLFPAIRPECVFVIKRELLRAPLVGWYLARSGQISVDRGGSTNAMRQMLEQAQARLDERLSLIIFPEGTRVAFGEPSAIKPGVSAIYRRMGMPVVPVALDSGRYWARKSFLRRPGTIRVVIGEPIEPGLPRPEFEARLRSALDAASTDTP